MHKTLSPELLAALSRVDGPTLSNAIEALHVRDLLTGFAGHRVRCLFPELGVTTGYAVTAQVDTTSEGAPAIGAGMREFMGLIDSSPKPVVVVYQDVGPRPGGAAFLGDYSANLMKRLGVAAFVCDGAIRDINEVRALGLACFALGTTVSHGNPRRVRINVPVTVDGLHVEPGDLIHCDPNGVLSVPLDVADKLMAEVAKVRALEREAIDFIRGPDFTLDAALKRMGH
jgi:4-hydroxy-4-methyl-2-oxoglutarate aldolase